MRTAGAVGLAVAMLTAVLIGVPPSPSANAASGPPIAIDVEFTANEAGYYVLDSYGRVSTFGSAPYYGGSPTLRAAEHAVSISPTPSGLGYWIFTDLGRVFAYGDATHFGDLDGITLDGPVLDSVPTPSGLGYYMLGDDGGIFTFGDAGFFGSIPGVLPPGTVLAGKIVGLAPTPTGLGYWLVGEDGGMFTFGDAVFFGSIPGVLPVGTVLAKAVVGMVPQGLGYLMVAADGGIFSFGQSVFHGSIPGLADPTARVQSAGQEIVAVMVRADDSGYIMLSRNGQIWVFGSVQALGTPDVSTPPNPGDSVNCSDFATQVDAQQWHDWRSPFYGDVARLDSDGDGRVCESLVSTPAQKVVSADGNLTVDVPDGAAPPGITVTVEPAATDAFGPNQVGAAYRLGPDGTTFSRPVTISLRVPSVPANVRSGSLQLGLRSSSGELTGLSTRLAPHPEGGFVLTSATSHFTDIGALPDSLPLDQGLMQLSCRTNGGPPFDCTHGPLYLNVDDQVSIDRIGGLAGPGALNLASTIASDVSLSGADGFRCERVGNSYVTVAASNVPSGVPVTPSTHLFVVCKPPDVIDMMFWTSPGSPTSETATPIDSVFVGRASDGGYRLGVQRGVLPGPNRFGVVFLDNPDTGQVEALTTRGEKHVGQTIGDVGGQVFFNESGLPLPNGYNVTNTADTVVYGVPAAAGNRSIIRLETNGPTGFDTEFSWTNVRRSIAEFNGSQPGGQGNPCVPTPTTLCLRGNRFQVDVDWKSSLNAGAGTVVDAGHEGGLFDFFDPASFELLVRVLDGCQTSTNSYWVFFQAATNVEYELTVTDTETKQVVRWVNPLGTPSPAVVDTSAFATCP